MYFSQKRPQTQICGPIVFSEPYCGIFKSGDPARRAAAIVKAVTNYTDARMIAELSSGLGEAMVGINENEIALLMAERGK